MFLKFLKNTRKSTWILIAIHLAIVLPLAYLLNIWLDEAWTMKTTVHGFIQTWTVAIQEEHQAPLYFSIISWWRILFDSLFGVRIFSIICSCLVIYLIPKLQEKYCPEVSPNILSAFVALNPYLIWASLEARGYSLVILLSTLLLLLFHKGYLEEKSDAKFSSYQFLYAFCALFALYSSYYLGFLLVAGAGVLLFSRRWKNLFAYVWQMAVVGLLFLPLIYWIFAHFGTTQEYVRSVPSIVESIKNTIWMPTNFVFPANETNEFLPEIRKWIFRLFILFAVIFSIKNFRNLFEENLNRLLVFNFVCGIFFALFYYFLGDVYVTNRHFAPLFISTILLFCVLAKNLFTEKGVIVWFIFFVSLSLAGIFAKYQPLAKRGDFARIAETIQKSETPNQPILIFRAFERVPFLYHYKGVNEIYPPLPTTSGPEAEEGSPVRWKKQFTDSIATLPENIESMWIINDSFCEEKITATECEPLENWINQGFTVERKENYFKQTLRFLKKKNK